MRVEIVTKPGCPRCLLLKHKLHLLGVGWDEATVDSLTLKGKNLPIVIIEGVSYEYAAAIKRLKEMLGEPDA